MTGAVPEASNSTRTFVDVRDVAVAHVLALETPDAAGRYVLVSESAFEIDVANILRDLCPLGKIPSRVSTSQPGKPVFGPQ